jgi:hypothetical protein
MSDTRALVASTSAMTAVRTCAALSSISRQALLGGTRRFGGALHLVDALVERCGDRLAAFDHLALQLGDRLDARGSARQRWRD